MNPETLFCLNPTCPAKGRVGEGNISVHSESEGRCRCAVCGDTFSQRKGTIFYRLRTEPTVVILVLTLLAYGCPVQAAAKAFELDERTVKAWWQRAGAHCESFHQYILGESQLDLQQVQADEIKVKTQGGSIWMAMAMMVSTRLWLGGGAECAPRQSADSSACAADSRRGPLSTAALGVRWLRRLCLGL